MSKEKADYTELHQALGEYVISFSQLVLALEDSIKFLVYFRTNVNYHFISALLADQTAQPLVSKFFAIFKEKWKDILTQEEKKFITKVKNEIISSIEKRNRYMHDAWLFSNNPKNDGTNVSLNRYRTTSAGIEGGNIKIDTELLRKESLGLRKLGSIITSLTFYESPSSPGPNISARFRINNEGKPEEIN